eukprot:IDg3649t1
MIWSEVGAIMAEQLELLIFRSGCYFDVGGSVGPLAKRVLSAAIGCRQRLKTGVCDPSKNMTFWFSMSMEPTFSVEECGSDKEWNR